MRSFKDFLREEKAATTIEIVLLIVVIIGVVLIFKSQLTTLINSIFSTITERAGTV